MPTFSIRAAYGSAVLLALATPAYAEILTVEYQATLGAVADAGWPAGVVVSGAYSFDSEAQPIFAFGTTEVHYPAITHNMTINGTPFTANSTPQIVILNDFPSGSLFRDQYLARAQMSGTFNGNLTISQIAVFFQSVKNPNNDLRVLRFHSARTTSAVFLYNK